MDQEQTGDHQGGLANYMLYNESLKYYPSLFSPFEDCRSGGLGVTALAEWDALGRNMFDECGLGTSTRAGGHQRADHKTNTWQFWARKSRSQLKAKYLL